MAAQCMPNASPQIRQMEQELDCLYYNWMDYNNCNYNSYCNCN